MSSPKESPMTSEPAAAVMMIEAPLAEVEALVAKIDAAEGLPRVDPMLSPGRELPPEVRTTRTCVAVEVNPTDKTKMRILLDERLSKFADGKNERPLEEADRAELQAKIAAATLKPEAPVLDKPKEAEEPVKPAEDEPVKGGAAEAEAVKK